MFWKEPLSNYFMFPSKDSQKKINISKAVNNFLRNLKEYSFFFFLLIREVLNAYVQLSIRDIMNRHKIANYILKMFSNKTVQ